MPKYSLTMGGSFIGCGVPLLNCT